ncbi:MAG: hypothetical protein JRJ12_10575 [Deltaproteobacteria bacterium]|nr:hypothetical protein [Deltaproteobacteria bacterium]MBW2071924.1 hypothetical protein [Deltaproteobacteria bacterium]
MVLLFFAMGCAGRVGTLREAEVSPAAILARLQQRHLELAGFRAAGTLQLIAPSQRMSGKVFLAARMPNLLRLELLSSMGQPVLYFVSDGQHYTVWSPGKSQAYTGTSSDDSLFELFELPVKDHEALLLLAGRLATRDFAATKIMRDARSGDLLLTLFNSAAGVTKLVWLDASGTRAKSVEVLGRNGRQLQVRFDNFKWTDGFFHPMELTLEASKVRFTLRYQKFLATGPADDEAFRLKLPPDVKILPR